MPREPLSKAEAGALIKKRREKIPLTQEQVVNLAGIPTITQLSEYEAGKVGFATGKHFPGLIRALGLSREDIEAINPAYIVGSVAEKPHPSSPAATGRRVPPAQERPIDPLILAAAAEYGGKPGLEGLRDAAWQRTLNDIPFHPDRRPRTPEDWLVIYKRHREEWQPREPDA